MDTPPPWKYVRQRATHDGKSRHHLGAPESHLVPHSRRYVDDVPLDRQQKSALSRDPLQINTVLDRRGSLGSSPHELRLNRVRDLHDSDGLECLGAMFKSRSR